MRKTTLIIYSVLLIAAAVLAAACAKAAGSSAYYADTVMETTAAWDRGGYNAAPQAKSEAYEMPAYFPEEEAEWDEAEPEEPEPDPTEPGPDLPGFTDSKLIYTCDLTIQTTEFENTLGAIRALINKYGGFIASESQNDNDTGWYRSDYVKTSATMTEQLTVRVPSEHYHDFLNALDGNGKIISKNMYVENISRQYSDTETTIKSLETQEERLLDIMEQCETVEDMITVEARLSEVQNELKIYRNRLSSMDTDVTYSTINMSIYEVLEYTPDKEPVKVLTFGDRLKNTLKNTGKGFMTFLEDSLFFLINALPYLLIVAGIVILIVWLIRKKLRKNEEKLSASRRAARQLPKKQPSDHDPEE